MSRAGRTSTAETSGSLRPLSALPPDVNRAEVRVFLKARDEAARLPYFLAYYRALGVDRFLVVDNQSTDGTTALLGAEADVHLFSAAGSFAAARGGQAWLDELLDRYGPGHWCLTVDADELLCFAQSETLDLPGLCRQLEMEGAAGLSCLMLDMYGAEPLGAATYRAGEPFLAACPWFDPAPYWRTKPSAECPPQEIYGGVRQRVFYPHWEAPSLRLRASEQCYDWANRFAAIRRNQMIQSWRVKRPPNLREGAAGRAGSRACATWRSHTGSRRCGCQPAAAVFSTSSFWGISVARPPKKPKRGEYFDGAREYKRYAAVIAEAPGLVLWHPGSVRFEGSAQLCHLGLMTPVAGRAHAGGAGAGACLTSPPGICTHDRPDYLRACLDGLAKQTTGSGDFEIVVVDSCSSTAAAARTRGAGRGGAERALGPC